MNAWFDSTRLIYGAFFASVVLHVGVLLVLYATNSLDIKKNSSKPIEVALRPKDPPASAVPVERKIIPKKETTYQPKEIERKEILKGISGQKTIKSPDNLKIFERRTEKIVQLNAVKKVSIEFISEKVNNPVYTSFEKRIGAIIHEKVDEKNANSPGNPVGTVVLSFILSRDGELLQVKIIEEKTSANEDLRRLVIESMSAVHFPSLANDYNVPKISFSIQITSLADK